MTGDVSDPPRDPQFFGRSSASAFARQITAAINFKLDPPAYTPVRPSGKLIDRKDFALPSRTVGERLLQAYYDGVWLHHPIHDWRPFMKEWESLWDTTKPHLDTFHCLLNVCFALGTQFDESIAPEDRRREGGVYWERCQLHFGNRIDLVPSQQGVVCLLLMGLFSQGTTNSIMCWMVIGAAIRMAQTLGLHLIKEGSFYDVEYGRRVWLGCVFLDRVLSITFGRPGMTSTTYTLPLMVDEEYFGTAPSPMRPDGKPTRMAFLIKAMELNDIYYDILASLYGDADDGQLLLVLKFDKMLSRWRESLPEHLKYRRFSRESVTLYTRYLQARMVVLKPIVTNFYIRPALDGSISDHVITACTSLCFDTAHEVVDVLHKHMDIENVLGLVPAWWYVVLFVYTAATILLLERVRPLNEPRPESWAKAREILKACSRVGEAGKRCVAALEMFDAKIGPEVPYDFGQEFGNDLAWMESTGADVMFAH